MNRIPQQRADRARDNMRRRASILRGEPDHSEYNVRLRDGHIFCAGEKHNQVVENETRTSYLFNLDSDGKVIEDVRELVEPDCHCRISSKKTPLYRCRSCRGLYCPRHITQVRDKAFCTVLSKCRMLGRLHKAGRIGSVLFKFGLTHALGIEFEKESQDVLRSPKNENDIVSSSDSKRQMNETKSEPRALRAWKIRS